MVFIPSHLCLLLFDKLVINITIAEYINKCIICIYNSTTTLDVWSWIALGALTNYSDVY